MQIHPGFRQAALSGAVFCGVLFFLMSADARVRERMRELVDGSTTTPWGDRLGDVCEALSVAVRHQSIENAPLLIFAIVGAVLFVCMVRA